MGGTCFRRSCAPLEHNLRRMVSDTGVARLWVYFFFFFLTAFKFGQVWR